MCGGRRGLSFCDAAETEFDALVVRIGGIDAVGMDSAEILLPFVCRRRRHRHRQISSGSSSSQTSTSPQPSIPPLLLLLLPH